MINNYLNKYVLVLSQDSSPIEVYVDKISPSEKYIRASWRTYCENGEQIFVEKWFAANDFKKMVLDVL